MLAESANPPAWTTPRLRAHAVGFCRRSRSCWWRLVGCHISVGDVPGTSVTAPTDSAVGARGSLRTLRGERHLHNRGLLHITHTYWGPGVWPWSMNRWRAGPSSTRQSRDFPEQGATASSNAIPGRLRFRNGTVSPAYHGRMLPAQSGELVGVRPFQAGGAQGVEHRQRLGQGHPQGTLVEGVDVGVGA